MKPQVLILLLCLAVSGCVSTPRLQDSDRPQVAGKTFVITGASSGFGRGVAVALGSHGANVVLAARRTALLEEVATEVRAAGGIPLVVTTDVSRPDQIDRLASAAVARFGKIDAWINNAGVGVIGFFEEAPVEDLSRLVDVNLKGVIYGSHAAMRQFKRQAHGTLVNTASIDSEVPLAHQAAYSATKAGVLALGRALNEETRLAGSPNIKVANVLPWAADTPWWTHAANYSGRAPRNLAMDKAQTVADAIAWVAVHPREELPVGWKARGAYLSHRLMPDLTERISANIQHRELGKAIPVRPHAGTLHRPMQEGRNLDGGIAERMEAEDESRKAREAKDR